MELLLFLILFISHSVFLVIVLNNMKNAPRLSNIKHAIKTNVKVSILIPARNEENKISLLLGSILNQSYRNYEIIVLDDNSSDNTADIVRMYERTSDKIKLINGERLSTGWFGKNWACHQLSKKANGELFLFIDADVYLNPDTLENALSLFQKNKLSMLSSFPTQKIGSFGEWLIVPLMNWVLLSFLPLKKVFSSKSKNFTAANGQFIMIKRDVYFKVGGHENIKNKVVEDMELAKLVKTEGGKVMTTLGDDVLFCNMYDSFTDGLNGFAKNFYPGFGISRFSFLLLITVLLFLFFLPYLLALLNFIFLSIVVMITLERIFISIMSGQNWLINILLHPFQMIIMYLTGLRSVFVKRKTWKGRKI